MLGKLTSQLVVRRSSALPASGSRRWRRITRHSPAAAATAGRPVKITDPTSVVLIVNRDSNDIGFMDIATHKMVGNVFLGNNVNPHMAMMSHDGRYVVTGGTRANKAYIIDVPTMTLAQGDPR